MNTEFVATPIEPQVNLSRHNGNGSHEALLKYSPRTPGGPARPPSPRAKGFRFGLQSKIIVPAAIVLLLSLAAIYVAVQHEAKVLEVSRLTALASAARSVQDKIDRCLFERYGDVQAFGLNHGVHRDLAKLTEPERADLTTLLNEYAKSYSCYDLSIITDPAGKIIAVNNQSPAGTALPNASRLIGRSLADNDGYRHAAAGQFTTYNAPGALTGTVVSAPEKSPLVAEVYGDKAPSWTISFTAPIRDSKTGELRGYWQNMFNSGMLEKIVLAEYDEQKKQQLPSSELNVIDAEGRLIVDVDPSETGNNEVRATDLLKNNFFTAGEDIAVTSKSSATADGTAFGKNVRMSKAAGHDFIQPGGFARSTPTLGFAGSGFTTLVRAEPKELFAITNALKLTTQITGVIGLGLGILVLWLISRKVVGGITRVQNAIVGLSQGDISQDILVRGNDEIGAMSHAFNQARQGLRKTFGQDQIDWIAVAELKVRAEIINMTSIVSESDLKGDILSVNDKFTEISQYGRDELIGRPHNTTRHPDMAKSVFKELWSTIGRGKPFRGVIKNRKKDGSPYYVDAVIAPVLGDDGKPKKYIGVRYDITDMELERQNMRGILSAIDSTYAYIEFDVKGQVITANANFLKALGYQLNEIVGRHHRTFVEPAFANSPAYIQFWTDLNAGISKSDIFKRIAKDGREVWIQAVYAPVRDEMGRVVKIIKIATDVTATKLQALDSQGQVSAIGKSQAVIEFNLEGTVLAANENFLGTLGYRLEEIKGQHHSLFVEPAYRGSAEYKQFWRELNEGKFQAAEYKRIGKGGREVWIQASYNPILDLNGKPFKVVKFATDISSRKVLEAKLKITMEAVAQNATTLSSAAEELTANSQQMVGNAEETSAQAGVVSAAAEQVSKNVQTVATGTEEMSASIKEIAKNAHDAAKVAATAVRAAETTNATISKLGDSSAEIGKVIKVITSIAQQTNLLALNATIEAARAGEAGKGFAVVANEVKELAKETAKATEDISQKIEAIQADTKSAVTAIAEISAVINKINDYQNTIASAVEEQTATTNEISRNVAEAAKGSTEIAQNITGVASAAKSTSSGAGDTMKAAAELSRMAAELQDVVASSKK